MPSNVEQMSASVIATFLVSSTSCRSIYERPSTRWNNTKSTCRTENFSKTNISRCRIKINNSFKSTRRGARRSIGIWRKYWVPCLSLYRHIYSTYTMHMKGHTRTKTHSSCSQTQANSAVNAEFLARFFERFLFSIRFARRRWKDGRAKSICRWSNKFVSLCFVCQSDLLASTEKFCNVFGQIQNRSTRAKIGEGRERWG